MTPRRSPRLSSALSVVAVLTLASCSDSATAPPAGSSAAGKSPEQDKSKDRPAVVSAALVAPREFVDSVEAIGTARANETVQLTSKVSDRIKSIRFTDGQLVRRGQVLVEMQADEQAADLAQARARLAEAQSQLARVEALVKDGWATQSRLETQIAARDSARAAMASLAARVADRFIRAPFTGVIGLRTVSPGLVAGSGTPLAEISDISQIKVDFTVPETQLSLVRRGQNIVAQSAALADARFTGKIEAIDPQIDPVTRAASVRAVVPNRSGALKPGMLLTVRIEQLRRSGLAVPEQAIVSEGDLKTVFVINGARDSVERTGVVIGARQPGFVEIVSGVGEGALVVSDGTVKVRDGGKIKITGPEPRAQSAQGQTSPAPLVAR